MAAGKPIVATAIGGNLELIRNGENGLLVPYGDAPALARALTRLASEPALAERLGGQARADVENHPWPNLVATTLTIFDQALEMRRSVS